MRVTELLQPTAHAWRPERENADRNTLMQRFGSPISSVADALSRVIPNVDCSLTGNSPCTRPHAGDQSGRFTFVPFVLFPRPSCAIVAPILITFNSFDRIRTGPSVLVERIAMKRVLAGLVVSIMACAVAWGQSTAQISGVVKDQSGAILPG